MPSSRRSNQVAASLIIKQTLPAHAACGAQVLEGSGASSSYRIGTVVPRVHAQGGAARRRLAHCTLSASPEMALRAFKQPAARLTGTALALFRNCCRNVPTGAHATAPSELKAPRRPRIKTLICTQVPTVLTLFDVDMSVREARGKVKDMFRQNAHIEDPRTAAILVHKGKAERAAAFESLYISYVGPRHGTALAIRVSARSAFPQAPGGHAPVQDKGADHVPPRTSRPYRKAKQQPRRGRSRVLPGLLTAGRAN